MQLEDCSFQYKQIDLYRVHIVLWNLPAFCEVFCSTHDSMKNMFDTLYAKLDFDQYCNSLIED